VQAGWLVTMSEGFDRGAELRQLISDALRKGDSSSICESVHHAESFLARVQAFSDRKLLDSAIDFINEYFDAMFRQNEFSVCDAVLSAIPIYSVDTDILLAILTATLPARSRLQNRHSFFELA